MVIPCSAYACTNAIRYCANACIVAGSVFMVPPSKGVTMVARRERALLHPGRRRPRAGPQPDVGLHRLRRLDVRDELLHVAIDREAGQLVVGPAGDLVVGVAIHRVVAGPDGDPAEDEPRSVGAIEQIDRGSRSAWLSMDRSLQPISLKAPPNPSQVCAVDVSSTVTSALRRCVTSVSAVRLQ